MQYKYDVVTKKGRANWSGTFQTEEDAQKWFQTWGVQHEQRGYKLILTKVRQRNNSIVRENI